VALTISISASTVSSSSVRLSTSAARQAAETSKPDLISVAA
jgi:hypothetical protein